MTEPRLRMFIDRTEVQCVCGRHHILNGIYKLDDPRPETWHQCECGAFLRIVHNPTWDGLCLHASFNDACTFEHKPMILRAMEPIIARRID